MIICIPNMLIVKSFFQALTSWQLCPIHTLAVAIVLVDVPNPLVFTMFSAAGIVPDIDLNASQTMVGAVSQLQATVLTKTKLKYSTMKN